MRQAKADWEMVWDHGFIGHWSAVMGLNLGRSLARAATLVKITRAFSDKAIPDRYKGE